MGPTGAGSNFRRSGAICQAIDLVLSTLAGNEYHMPTNLAYYEDLSQLEDDIVSFLPTVSDIEVFGCEIDLIEPDTHCHWVIPSAPRYGSKTGCM